MGGEPEDGRARWQGLLEDFVEKSVAADNFDYKGAFEKFFKDDFENSIQDNGISDINISVEMLKPIPEEMWIPEDWVKPNHFITKDEIWDWMDTLNLDPGKFFTEVSNNVKWELADNNKDVPYAGTVFSVNSKEAELPEFRGASLKDRKLAMDYKVNNVMIASPHTRMESLFKKLREQLGA